SHANDRFDQDFQVDQLMHEYSLLRLILPEEIAEHLKRDLTPEEVRLVHLSIDSSVRHAVTEFGDNMNHRLHGEAEALAKYLAFLSHDLRGNLNGAMLMIEVLRRDMRKEGRFSDQVEDLEEMRMTMLGTVATMDRFLQAERLRQKAVEPSVSLVDVNLVISQTWTTTGRDHPERQLTLDLQIEPELSIVTDRELFVLIVHNLISNARRHAKSSVKVHMTAEPLPDDSDLQGASQWTLSVSDDGGGIEPAVRPHLFNAFGRGVHRSGTGLGLFIVKSAADILNAEIHVESDPGHGATFVVEKH
ncbi:MAG: HAMP domain-containing sensor histidine kinase, partial [Planctomycetota bacterium]